LVSLSIALRLAEAKVDRAPAEARTALLAASEELSQAIVEFQRVLQLQPTHTAARKDLAAALARAGRATEARALTLAHVRQ